MQDLTGSVQRMRGVRGTRRGRGRLLGTRRPSSACMERVRLGGVHAPHARLAKCVHMMREGERTHRMWKCMECGPLQGGAAWCDAAGR